MVLIPSAKAFPLRGRNRHRRLPPFRQCHASGRFQRPLLAFRCWNSLHRRVKDGAAPVDDIGYAGGTVHVNDFLLQQARVSSHDALYL